MRRTSGTPHWQAHSRPPEATAARAFPVPTGILHSIAGWLAPASPAVAARGGRVAVLWRAYQVPDDPTAELRVLFRGSNRHPISTEEIFGVGDKARDRGHGWCRARQLAPLGMGFHRALEQMVDLHPDDRARCEVGGFAVERNQDGRVRKIESLDLFHGGVDRSPVEADDQFVRERVVMNTRAGRVEWAAWPARSHLQSGDGLGHSVVSLFSALNSTMRPRRSRVRQIAATTPPPRQSEVGIPRGASPPVDPP